MTTFGTPPDDPQQPSPASAEPQPAAPSGVGTVSPDGRWVWDGTQWNPAAGPPAGHVPPPPPAAHHPAPYPGAPYGAPIAPVMPCPNCGNPFGLGLSCQVCAQVANFPVGIRLSSAGRRLGAYLLDGLLAVVTLLIGWVIWSLIIWKDGLTPGKSLLHMRVAKKSTGTPATWGTMCLRELVGKGLVMGGLAALTFGIAPLILNFMLLWDKERQQLWDKIAGTLVVDDPPAPAVAAAPGA